MAIYLHEHFTGSVIRIYNEPEGYAKRKPCIVSVTVTYTTFDTVVLSNMMRIDGRVTRNVIDKILNHLKKQGVKTVLFERHGRKITRNL